MTKVHEYLLYYESVLCSCKITQTRVTFGKFSEQMHNMSVKQKAHA